MGRLIIDGSRVYELDEECLRKKKIPEREPVQSRDDGRQKKRRGYPGAR